MTDKLITMIMNDMLITMAAVDKLVRNPASIERLGKTRRSLCAGGCGRLVWMGRCRKCRRHHDQRT